MECVGSTRMKRRPCLDRGQGRATLIYTPLIGNSRALHLNRRRRAQATWEGDDGVGVNGGLVGFVPPQMGQWLWTRSASEQRFVRTVQQVEQLRQPCKQNGARTTLLRQRENQPNVSRFQPDMIQRTAGPDFSRLSFLVK